MRDNRSTAVTQVYDDRGHMHQSISAGVTTTYVYNALVIRRQRQVFDFELLDVCLRELNLESKT